MAVGCTRPIYLMEQDANHYVNDMHLPKDLMTHPLEGPADPFEMSVPPPSTVDHPDVPMRPLSVAEAISIALERGTVGAVIPTGQGTDALLGFTGGEAGNPGGAVLGSDSIRALALDPAAVGANIEASLSKFDAVWNTSMTWNTQDTPIATAFQQFQAGNTQLEAIQQQTANFSSSLLKPLPTGGVAGITFSNAYTFSNLPSRVNPAYQPDLQFQFEQPLLQGYGVEINQIRTTHPGSLLTPFAQAARAEGILIARIRFDEQRAEFQRNVHVMVANVELAYWNLYGAYWNLYSQEAAMRQAYEAWKITKAKYEAGKQDAPLAVYAQSRAQYELFRSQRLTALGAVLEGERQLRILMGLPASDGTRLVPIDAPTLAPYQPDWETAVHEALTLRPELLIIRDDLKFRQLDLINQQNLLLPDLRFTATYDIVGIGSRLDSNNGNNALRDLVSDHFNNWALGLRLQMPIGHRDAHAAVRVARLNVARSYYTLQDAERKTINFLALNYRHLFEFYNQIAILRAEREAYGQQLKAQFAGYKAGLQGYTLDILLESQRFWATALASEYANVVNYQNALIGFEFSKGTILQHDNIVIAEGALPECASVRAAVHAEERAKALVLRERANPVPFTPCCGDGSCGMPMLPKDSCVALPSLIEGAKGPEPLPGPPLPTAPGMTDAASRASGPPSVFSAPWLTDRSSPASTPSQVPPDTARAPYPQPAMLPPVTGTSGTISR
jgi:outer membrane protein TolC